MAPQSARPAEEQFARELGGFFAPKPRPRRNFSMRISRYMPAPALETPVYRLSNTAPLFWGTILGAVQAGAFVVLGRIFDLDSAHNLGRLQRLA